MDGKLLRGNIQDKEDSGLTNLTGFLLKAGWVKKKQKMGDEEFGQIPRVEVFHSTDPTDFLL